MRDTEVKGVAKLLLSDYETAEDCAKAIIKWLDEDRGKRTSYISVMQFGEQRPVFYLGLGPYPGVTSASKAAMTHPAADEAHKVVVVPVTSKEGFENMMKKIDVYKKGVNK